MDSNPESCRNKQACYTNLATHLTFNFSARVAGRHLPILANKRGGGRREGAKKRGFHSIPLLRFSFVQILFRHCRILGGFARLSLRTALRICGTGYQRRPNIRVMLLLKYRKV